MILREIKITNQPTLHVYIPESWDDVTFKQVADLQKEEDPLKRLAILTGIPDFLFDKYPELADFYVWVESKLSWSNEWKENESKLEVFILEDDVFHFPEDIGIHSVGLYEDIKKELQENKGNEIVMYPLICASYYQILKDGKYDYTKAAEYIEVFNQQPCRKVFNSATFFLNKIQRLRSGTGKEPKTPVTQMIKKLLGLKGYQKYSGLKLSSLN